MKVVVHCKTRDEWDIVSRVLGYKWQNPDSFDSHREFSCIDIYDKGYAYVDFFQEEEYTILSFNEWLKTLDEPIKNEEIDEDLSYLIDLFKKLNIK